MTHFVSAANGVLLGEIDLPVSKSHLNRLLALQILSKSRMDIRYQSDADDVRVMEMALALPEATVIDVGAAGTAMRFLTACFSVLPGTRVLSGSNRMKQRPIAPLVDALTQLGVDIRYLDMVGYPPIEIVGGLSTGGHVNIRGDVSSQFVSALMLIGPFVHHGIHIHFSTPVTSFPYLEMTAETIRQLGGIVHLSKTEVKVEVGISPKGAICPERDWSAAAFWFEAAALAKECNILLKNLSFNSIQGDVRAAELWSCFGLEISQEQLGVRVTKSGVVNLPTEVDFFDCPDLAQAYAATVAGLQLNCKLTGLKTLRIKETDRLFALKTELEKLGCKIEVGDDWIEINCYKDELQTPLVFDTYQDHRMAMCLAPLALIFDEVVINNPEVVSKSYPDYWNVWKGLEK